MIMMYLPMTYGATEGTDERESNNGRLPDSSRLGECCRFTQTGNLPDAVNPDHMAMASPYIIRPSNMVEFVAILEDRKFKSPPSEVIDKAIGVGGEQNVIPKSKS